MADQLITSSLIWRPIQRRCDFRPDADMEYLVYDGYLDDVVKGYAEDNDDGSIDWFDVQTELPLKDPQFWTDVPFPEDK